MFTRYSFDCSSDSQTDSRAVFRFWEEGFAPFTFEVTSLNYYDRVAGAAGAPRIFQLVNSSANNSPFHEIPQFTSTDAATNRITPFYVVLSNLNPSNRAIEKRYFIEKVSGSSDWTLKFDDFATGYASARIGNDYLLDMGRANIEQINNGAAHVYPDVTITPGNLTDQIEGDVANYYKSYVTQIRSKAIGNVTWTNWQNSSFADYVTVLISTTFNEFTFMPVAGRMYQARYILNG